MGNSRACRFWKNIILMMTLISVRTRKFRRLRTGDKKAAKTYECNGYKFNKGMDSKPLYGYSLIGKNTKMKRGSRGR